MKILDIIIPHETLIENRVTNWFARTFARSAGTTAESKVSSWVDSAIRELETANPGHVIKRTKELKQAESALVAVVERNPYPDELAKIDSLATSLSEYLITTGRPSVEGANAIETLATLVRQGSVKPPSVYGSKEEFLSDPFIVSEIRGLATAAGARLEMAGSKYIRELAEARAQVYKEIKNIEPVKTRAQKKKEQDAEELAAKQAETSKIKTDNELQTARNTAEDLKVLKNKADLVNFWKNQGKLTKYFAGSEFARVSTQYGQQINNIQTWDHGYENGTPIPEDIAKYFPVVPEGGVKEGSPSIKATVNSPLGKPYYYRTNKQRYEKAADYAFSTISTLYLKQLGTGTISWIAPSLTAKTVSWVGGKMPLLGKSKTIHSILEVFNNALANSPRMIKLLGGMSLAGKMLFVDFMMTNVVAEQPSSENLAYWLNSALGKITGVPVAAAAEYTNSLGWTELTPEELEDARKGLSLLPNYEKSPELNKAWASLMVGSSIAELPDSYAKEFLMDGVATYLVPYAAATNLFLEIGSAFLTAGKYIFPLIVKAMGTTSGKLPTTNGEQPPVQVAPPDSAASAPNAAADQTDMSGDGSQTTTSSDASQGNNNTSQSNNNNNVPPAVVAKPPVNTRTTPRGKVTPSDNGYLDESINESLKRRVAQLMKS
jgi:hypothetical protein